MGQKSVSYTLIFPLCPCVNLIDFPVQFCFTAQYTVLFKWFSAQQRCTIHSSNNHFCLLALLQVCATTPTWSTTCSWPTPRSSTMKSTGPRTSWTLPHCRRVRSTTQTARTCMPESRRSTHYFVDTSAKNHVEPVQNSPCNISVELMFGNFYVKALGRF